MRLLGHCVTLSGALCFQRRPPLRSQCSTHSLDQWNPVLVVSGAHERLSVPRENMATTWTSMSGSVNVSRARGGVQRLRGTTPNTRFGLKRGGWVSDTTVHG